MTHRIRNIKSVIIGAFKSINQGESDILQRSGRIN